MFKPTGAWGFPAFAFGLKHFLVFKLLIYGILLYFATDSKQTGGRVSKERFSEILKEYGFTDRQIEFLWDTRPSDDLNEHKLRETAEHIEPMKNRLTQA